MNFKKYKNLKIFLSIVTIIALATIMAGCNNYQYDENDDENVKVNEEEYVDIINEEIPEEVREAIKRLEVYAHDELLSHDKAKLTLYQEDGDGFDIDTVNLAMDLFDYQWSDNAILKAQLYQKQGDNIEDIYQKLQNDGFIDEDIDAALEEIQ